MSDMSIADHIASPTTLQQEQGSGPVFTPEQQANLTPADVAALDPQRARDGMSEMYSIVFRQAGATELPLPGWELGLESLQLSWRHRFQCACRLAVAQPLAVLFRRFDAAHAHRSLALCLDAKLFGSAAGQVDNALPSAKRSPIIDPYDDPLPRVERRYFHIGRQR